MISPLERNDQIIDDDGRLSLRATLYFEEMTRIVNLNTPIQGAGSPEGVLTAEITQRYIDTAGAAGSISYIKKTGAGNTGWVLV